MVVLWLMGLVALLALVVFLFGWWVLLAVDWHEDEI